MRKITIDEAKKIINESHWIESTSKGFGAAGETLENYLKLPKNDLQISDAEGFELKTTITNSLYYNRFISLFSLTPDGRYPFETFRLKDTYGYPDKDYPDKKILNVSIYSNYYKNVRNSYLFKLKVDYKQQKVLVEVFDTNKKLIENFVYWDFDDLKAVLDQKINTILLVEARRRFAHNIVSFKYENPKTLKRRNFGSFLSALENGHIRVTFKVGLYKRGFRFLEAHDRGTSFEIKKNSLSYLFIIT